MEFVGHTREINVSHWHSRASRKQRLERLSNNSIMTGFFPKSNNDINFQVHEDQRAPIRFKTNKFTLQHTIIKLSKSKPKRLI